MRPIFRLIYRFSADGLVYVKFCKCERLVVASSSLVVPYIIQENFHEISIKLITTVTSMLCNQYTAHPGNTALLVSM
jgi:hypothetical protein